MSQEIRMRETAALSETYKRATNAMAQRLEASGMGTQEIMSIVLAALSEFSGALIYSVGIMSVDHAEFCDVSVKMMSAHMNDVIRELRGNEGEKQ